MTAAALGVRDAGRLRWPTAVRLAIVGGRADRVRIALTAGGAAAATLALLSAATVAATGPDDGPYTGDLLNQPTLHPGVVIALVLLCVPLLAFTGQCSRVGAPARDRRLATFRLTGATPAEVNRIAAAETGLAALLGSLLGLALYLGGRVVFGGTVVARYSLQHDELQPNGSTYRITEDVHGPALRLPTDVLPPGWVIAALVLAMPLLALGFALFALRRVATTPFGVTRARTVRPVQVVPAVLFVAGTVGLGLFTTLARVTGLEHSADAVVGISLLVLLLVTLTGLLLGTAAFAARLGGFVAARARRPAWIIAGRRLVAEPFAASRANAALLVIVLLAAAVQGYRVALLLDEANSGTDFYAQSMDLVDVGLAVAGAVAAAALLVGLVERVVSGRRTTAALSAAGVPRGVLARAAVLEMLLPVVPATLLATAAGILAARGILGTNVRTSTVQPDGSLLNTYLDIPVPWTPLAVIVGAALLGTALLAAVAVPLVRRSADPGELRTE